MEAADALATVDSRLTYDPRDFADEDAARKLPAAEVVVTPLFEDNSRRIVDELIVVNVFFCLFVCFV